MFDDLLICCLNDENWPRAIAYARSLAPSSGGRTTVLVRKAADLSLVDADASTRVVHCRSGLAESIGFHAAWADVVVIDAPAALADLESILCDGGRPCAVLPFGARTPAPPRRIAVGWNGSLESMRALKAALPLLRRAEHVVVLDAGRKSHEMCDATPCAATWLAERGIFAARVRSDSAAQGGRTLVELAAEHAVDLLVLGAYRHQRFTEWDTGATLDQVLRDGDIPVLLGH